MNEEIKLFLEEVKNGWKKADDEYMQMFGESNLKELIKWGKITIL